MTHEAEQIRTVARSVRILADGCRETARQVDGSAAVAWSSDAADAYRGRVQERARELRRCADGLDELERRLLVMARVVETRITAVLALPDRVVDIVREPVTKVAVQEGLRRTPLAPLADPGRAARTLVSWSRR